MTQLKTNLQAIMLLLFAMLKFTIPMAILGFIYDFTFNYSEINGKDFSYSSLIFSYMNTFMFVIIATIIVYLFLDATNHYGFNIKALDRFSIKKHNDKEKRVYNFSNYLDFFSSLINSLFERYVWGIFAEPPKFISVILKVLPFILLVVAYQHISDEATAEDSRQKIYPSYSKMVKKIEKYMLSPNKRINKEAYTEWKPLNKQIIVIDKDLKSINAELASIDAYNSVSKQNQVKFILENPKFKYLETDSEMKSKDVLEDRKWSKILDKWSLKIDAYAIGLPNSLLLQDTASSLYRLLVAMTISAGVALIISIYMGMYKLVDYTVNDISTVYSLIQPVAILPIIMIIFGVEDYGKIVFISLGVIPPMLLTTYLNVKAVPKQTIVKAKTLSASDFQVIRKVILPQILPHFINTFRLTLFLGWMLLLSAEMISAENGLGYRIMLEKRFTNMDIIIPYVLWIMMMSFMTDKALQLLNKKMFPWFTGK
jgi:NitT/TauT family transport system permease protein